MKDKELLAGPKMSFIVAVFAVFILLLGMLMIVNPANVE